MTSKTTLDDIIISNFYSLTGKIDALVKDNKNIRRISATQLENQLQSTWQILQQVLSDYQNSKQGLIISIVNILT